MEKVNEGKFRTVYELDGKAVKEMKQTIQKSYGTGFLKFTVDFNIGRYTKNKFGIADFNEEEQKNYLSFINRVPPQLRQNFYNIIGLYKTKNGSLLYTELVKNSDGTVSRRLSDYRNIREDSFWNQIRNMREFMLDERVYLLDVSGDNIVVKNTGSSIIPVWIDYKRIGRRTYPFQLSTLTEELIRRKLKRRFDRLETEFNKP